MKTIVIEVDALEGDPVRAIGPFPSQDVAEQFISGIEDGCFEIVTLISKEAYEKELDRIDAPVLDEPIAGR